MLTLFLMDMLTLAFAVQTVESEPRTFVVPDDYPTIRQAINAVNDGDTIYVKAGTYYENVIVDKSVSLIGEDKERTVIDGSEVGTVVHVVVDNVTITRLEIRNSCMDCASDIDSCGIYVEGVFNVNITDTTVIDNGYGIYLSNCLRTTVTANTLSNLYAGLLLEHSDGNMVINNSISNNTQAIRLDDSDANAMSYNTVTNNLWAGIELSGRKVGVSERNVIHNNIITHNGPYGVRLWDVDNNVLANNTITNNEHGIRLKGHGNIIENNTIAVNQCGLLLDGSSDNNIYHNNFVKNRQQVDLIESYDTWDNGYPSGGNFWSDYEGPDEHNGLDQDQPGSDGIGDTPYIINEDNKDCYPLMRPLFTHEHDLAVTLWTPTSIITGTPTTLEATLSNLGISDETDVHLQLLIESEIVESEIIPELASGLTYTLNYSWTPTIESIYNITAHVIPVPQEYTLINNVESVHVNVYTPVVGHTKIHLHPSGIQATTGATFTVDVNIANVRDMAGWQVSIYYRNDILESIEANEGPFLKTGGPTLWPHPVIANNYNATHGYILIGCVLLGDIPGVNGNGTVATITFRAKASGDSPLSIDLMDTYILDSQVQAELIFFEAENGHVIVVTAIYGDLNSDGKVDIQDFAVAANAFGSYSGHPRWNPMTDLNKDNIINIVDLVLIVKNFGK